MHCGSNSLSHFSLCFGLEFWRIVNLVVLCAGFLSRSGRYSFRTSASLGCSIVPKRLKGKKHIIIHNSYNAWWPITVLGCWFLCFRFCFVLCCLSRCFYFLFFFNFFLGKGEGVPTEKLSIRQMRKQLSRSSSSIHARNILDTVYLLSR